MYPPITPFTQTTQTQEPENIISWRSRRLAVRAVFRFRC
jgi:hypothetical protein